MEPVRWGILGTAKIAVEKVIPGFRRTDSAEVVAIASRDAARAQACAARLGIPKAYGGYEALLADAADTQGLEIDSDQTLYAVHGADGERLAVMLDRDTAFAAAVAHELAPVSVH